MRKCGFVTGILVLVFVIQPGIPAQAARAAPSAESMGLMPVPEHLSLKQGFFPIDAGLTIGARGPQSRRAFLAAARFMARLAGRTGIFFEQDFLAPPGGTENPSILYAYARTPIRAALQENEAYSLKISDEGVLLEAETDIGIVRGFETLLQLLTSDAGRYVFPYAEISDRPRFAWRGLLIDSGRHFQPVEVIKRNLEGMAAVKMNVLHWHLTEDQGFRVESRVRPGLHMKGSDGLYYTQSQIRDMIAYADDLGIRVMPEFDIPGHSTSWFAAHPELASAPGPYAIERKFGVFGPAFNPAEEAVYAFLDKFLGEMAGLFPDPYVHIGGDEVEGKQWDANTSIQAFMKKHGLKDNHALQAHFNSRILRILNRYGKIMVGWDEIFQPGLPPEIVIQSWRGQEALAEAARKGYKGILSNGYYIDLCQPAEDHYLNDPVPLDSPLNEAQKKLVLGGEATMWSELVTPETIDSRIWPRTAAIAERLWSPQSVRDVEEMYRRLDIVGRGLEELGLTHIKNRAMMLRRLAASAEIGPLEILADVTEPLKRYQRHSQGVTYTSLSPMTRFVDACHPESMAARRFRITVDRFLATGDLEPVRELRESLTNWAANHHNVLPLVARSPVLAEIESLSLALASVSQTGLEAIDLLAAGAKSDPIWIESKRTQLAEAKKPKAHAELAVTAGIEKLLNALAGK